MLINSVQWATVTSLLLFYDPLLDDDQATNYTHFSETGREEMSSLLPLQPIFAVEGTVVGWDSPWLTAVGSCSVATFHLFPATAWDRRYIWIKALGCFLCKNISPGRRTGHILAHSKFLFLTLVIPPLTAFSHYNKLNHQKLLVWCFSHDRWR